MSLIRFPLKLPPVRRRCEPWLAVIARGLALILALGLILVAIAPWEG
jgi:hypothetical protein